VSCLKGSVDLGLSVFMGDLSEWDLRAELSELLSRIFLNAGELSFSLGDSKNSELWKSRIGRREQSRGLLVL